jgi:hypothetical protein
MVSTVRMGLLLRVGARCLNERAPRLQGYGWGLVATTAATAIESGAPVCETSRATRARSSVDKAS